MQSDSSHLQEIPSDNIWTLSSKYTTSFRFRNVPLRRDATETYLCSSSGTFEDIELYGDSLVNETKPKSHMLLIQSPYNSTHEPSGSRMYMA